MFLGALCVLLVLRCLVYSLGVYIRGNDVVVFWFDEAWVLWYFDIYGLLFCWFCFELWA